MAGVTSTGFVTKRFPDVLEGLREQAIPIFQDLVTPGDSVDTSDSTVIGRLIGLTSPALADLWEVAQEVYSAFDPNTASGIPLDNLVAIGGVTRKVATSTTFSGVVWGDTNTIIQAGSVVTDSSTGNQFSNKVAGFLSVTDAIGVGVQVSSVVVGNACSVTLTNASGVVTTITTTVIAGDTKTDILSRLLTQLTTSLIYTAELIGEILYIRLIQHYSSFNISLGGNLASTKVAKRLEFASVEKGAIPLSVGAATTISTPVFGWDSVNNPVPAVIGNAQETDDQLRERFRVSKFLRANNLFDSLYSALTELSGVSEVKLYVNDTDLTDSIGLAPHSFMVLILGGDDTEIAQVIWKHTPLGINSYGEQTVAVQTQQGNEQIVRFDRPQYVQLYAQVDISTFTDFPSGGEGMIKKALSEYINSTQEIGGKVVYSRLFNPVNTIPGHEIVTLRIGTSAGSLSETTINMAYNQIPVLAEANITVV